MAKRSKARSEIDDARLGATLKALLTAEKSIGIPVSWALDGAERSLRFRVPLDIDGATEEGFFLTGRASLTIRDADVSFCLVWQDAILRPVNFERIDWRPRTPHSNGADAPSPLKLMLIPAGISQRHPLAENAALRCGIVSAMLDDNLPVAAALDPEPSDWDSLLRQAGAIWSVDNMGSIPLPPWEEELLPFIDENPKLRGGRT